MKLLAAVYNPIAYDGRVQRECEALSEIAQVELLCPHGPPVSGLPFKVTELALPNGANHQLRRHLQFYQAFVKLARRTRPDVIHAHDYFMAASGATAAALSDAALVYDAHELIIPEAGRPMSRRARLWYYLERWAIGRAELVIAANDDRARLMHEHYVLSSPPLVVRNIPVPPQGGTYSEALLHKSGEQICVYQGDISFQRGLSRILHAVPFMPENVHLVLIGSGPDPERVRQEIAHLGIESRVTLLGRVKRDELHSILRTCHVGLLLYPFEGLNNIYCAPNKLFEYAQAGLPVVTTDQPPLKEVVTKFDIGAFFGPTDNPSSVAQKVTTVLAKQGSYRDGLNRLLSENTWRSEAQRLQRAVLATVEKHASGRKT